MILYPMGGCLVAEFGLKQSTLRHQYLELENAVAFSLALLRARLRLRASFQRRVGRYGNATAVMRENHRLGLQLLA